ncbi:MAG: DNA mismatch repair protein MutS [Longimicrobiales bacterium]|nr:DNA mismatch repair protein MutS [Longimicrobiales bacterium]
MPDDTPLMQQWRDAKSRHRDALVFFRVGDFYELFNQDAEEGARLLGLTLTSRNNGAAARVPLAGIPVKALDEYLARLVRAGKRVAICEQVEDPAEARGIVRREVVETVTPGTVLHDALLADRRNTFLAAVVKGSGAPASEGSASGRPATDRPAPAEAPWALAALDLSTGEFTVRAVPAGTLADEVGRIEPAELLLPRSLQEDPALAGVASPLEGGPARTVRDDWVFDAELAREELQRRFGVRSLEGFGFRTEGEAGAEPGAPDDRDLVRAGGALVTYVHEIRPGGVAHLEPPRILRPGSAMVLDRMTRRNLELVEPLRAGAGEGGEGTLLAVLDRAATAMGGRLLRRWVLNPLVAPAEIWARQEAVEELVTEQGVRRRLRDALRRVADLERLAGKMGTGRGTPRDLRALARSLAQLPAVAEACGALSAPLLRTLTGELDLLAEVRALLDGALADDPPAALSEGGVIRPGFDEALDELRALRDGAVDFIASLQTRERERTGIASLKVGFNKVFGYYLEVTRANLDRVPDDYVRKQTLANGERYFTPELKEWEEKVFGAEDRMAQLEARLFGEVRERAAGETARLQKTARRVAALDVLAALAEGAEEGGYVRPEVHTGYDLEIEAGRHPVVETMMPREEFIPNDVRLAEDGFIVILTGPNMAGKSTVLRQVGLIQLLAQMGAFVPARRARLPVVDRIFTRVGASDNLARGESTFMVEMHETAAILHGASDRSLVLLDEIGRGTSTYDGVSIAWAVTEHLHEAVGCKTVFATHYHELTQLGDLLPGVVNRNVAVREAGDDIVFLRRLEPGGADRSYGIQVARLAGVPRSVIARAAELLHELEGTHSGGGEGLGRHGALRPRSEAPPDQLTLFTPEHPLLARLRNLALEEMTPLEALNLLSRLRAEARGDREPGAP